MRPFVSLGVMVAWVASGCSADSSSPSTRTELLLISPSLLAARQPLQIRLTEDRLARVELTWGQLPSGLTLGSGWLRGTPDLPGETQRFTLRASDGARVVERSYTLAVDSDVQQVNLVSSPPVAIGEALSFDGLAWSTPVDRAFAWDATLDLVWPLRGGTAMSGAGLLPLDGTLSLIAGGSQGAGSTNLHLTPADPSIDTVAQLSWAQAADINLEVLASSTASPGGWSVHHPVARETSPGPEVVTLSSDAAPGRYALVATKAGGDQVDVTLWLTIHRRDGSELTQRRFDALFSDTAQASLLEEIGRGRQSYLPLGVVDVARDGQRHYWPPTGSPDPFVVEGKP